MPQKRRSPVILKSSSLAKTALAPTAASMVSWQGVYNGYSQERRSPMGHFHLSFGYTSSTSVRIVVARAWVFHGNSALQLQMQSVNQAIQAIAQLHRISSEIKHLIYVLYLSLYCGIGVCAGVSDEYAYIGQLCVCVSVRQPLSMSIYHKLYELTVAKEREPP